MVIGDKLSVFEAFFYTRPLWTMYTSIIAAAILVLSIFISFCCCFNDCSKNKNQHENQDTEMGSHQDAKIQHYDDRINEIS